jgi:hypothetical protein
MTNDRRLIKEHDWSEDVAEMNLDDQLTNAAEDLRDAEGHERSTRIHRFLDLNETRCHVMVATGYADQCIWIGTKNDRILLDVEMLKVDLLEPLELFATVGDVSKPVPPSDTELRSTLAMMIHSAKIGELTKTQVVLAESILNAFDKEYGTHD